MSDDNSQMIFCKAPAGSITLLMFSIVAAIILSIILLLGWPPGFFGVAALTIWAGCFLTLFWFAIQSCEVIIDPEALLVTEKIAFLRYRRERQWTFIDINSVLVHRTTNRVPNNQKTIHKQSRIFYSLRLRGTDVEVDLPLKTNDPLELEATAMRIAALGCWKAYRSGYALGDWRGKNSDKVPAAIPELQEITRLRPSKQSPHKDAAPSI